MNVFRRHQLNGILNASANIFRLKIRIVILDDLFKRDAFPNQFEYALNWYPCASNTRFAEMHIWVDFDSLFHLFHLAARCPDLLYSIPDLLSPGSNGHLRAGTSFPACNTARVEPVAYPILVFVQDHVDLTRIEQATRWAGFRKGRLHLDSDFRLHHTLENPLCPFAVKRRGDKQNRPYSIFPADSLRVESILKG